MKRTEEWDWPPPRRQRFYRTIEYRPSGWNKPCVRKAVSIYWRTMIIAIKMPISIPLAMMVVGAATAPPPHSGHADARLRADARGRDGGVR
jgi:hypothetical protein